MTQAKIPSWAQPFMAESLRIFTPVCSIVAGVAFLFIGLWALLMPVTATRAYHQLLGELRDDCPLHGGAR